MGQISKADRFLIMSLRKKEKWGASGLILESDGRRQVLLVCFKKLTTTGQSKGSRAVALIPVSVLVLLQKLGGPFLNTLYM